VSSSSLYETGLEKRRQVVGTEYVDRVLADVDDFDRDWQRLLTEYCWGEVWGGDALSNRQRSLNNLCLLAPTGRREEFEAHFRGALRNGCTLAELRETLKQIAVYAGVPAELSAFGPRSACWPSRSLPSGRRERTEPASSDAKRAYGPGGEGWICTVEAA
jgi:4-carboxymuconolactone decarboxylase